MIPAVRKSISSFVIPEKYEREAFETQNFVVNHYALVLASKLCSIDGDLNLTERRAFLSLFPYFNQSHLGLFNDCCDDESSIYNSSRKFCKFTNDNVADSARLFAKLFKLAISDGALNTAEISFFEKFMPMIGLNKFIFHKALEFYFMTEIKMPKKLMPEKDIKTFFKNQISDLHPDIFYGASYLSKSTRAKLTELANERMKMLNENYRKTLH